MAWRRLSRIIGPALLLLTCGCEAWRENARYWNSPEGQAASAAMLQGFQQQQALSQRRYEFDQTMLLERQRIYAETARSMQPIRIQHSGRVQVEHSGSVRIRR